MCSRRRSSRCSTASSRAAAAEAVAPAVQKAAVEPMHLESTPGATAKAKLVLHSHARYSVGELSTMYWLGCGPDDVHLNISSHGWAKHAWSCVFAPWNAG